MGAIALTSTLMGNGTASGGEPVDFVPGREEDEPKEVILGFDDRRFRRQFNLALARLRVRGDITADQFYKYRAATFNTMEVEDGKAFVQRLREECEELAGDLMDDLVKWWEWLVQWIVENWATILKVVLALLVFLDGR